jgi:hypothetical protein
MAVFGEQPHTVALTMHDQAVAVVLDLMKPVCAPLEPWSIGKAGMARIVVVWAWILDRWALRFCQTGQPSAIWPSDAKLRHCLQYLCKERLKCIRRYWTP